MPKTKSDALRYKLNDQKEWVKNQMKRNGMTQKELAERLGVSQSRICEKLKLDDGESYKGGIHRCGRLESKDMLLFIEIFNPTDKKIAELMRMSYRKR